MTAVVRRFRTTAVLGLVFALLATVIAMVGTSAPASAAPSGSTFQPGYIVSDANFFNYNSMTVTQIQAFLDLKGPTNCNGCLKNYRASTYDRAADPGRCVAPLVGKSNISAAQMIYDVAQACHINPMTLLVTMQKETSLVTMSAPEAWRYQRAMGYGCPDAAPCSTDYYGMFIQLYTGAGQLVRYGNPGTIFTWYPVGAWTAVRYSPNAACGSSAVYIQNRATAALYYYTPYQPNPAALTNLYGTGDSCSAYGNRNFWRTWWDWFGDPTGALATPTASVTPSPSPSASPSPSPSASPSPSPSPSATPATTTSTTTSTTTTSTTTSTTTTSTTTTTAPTTTTTTSTTTTTAPPAPPAPTVITYTVVPGDTLSKIAARYKTTVAAIAADNAIKNVSLIYVGQKLKITVPGTTSTPTTTTPPPPVSTPTTTTPPPPATTTTVTYTVVAGDTLYKIAAKFHTTVAAIASANGITNANLIRVGQKLKIPASGSTTTTATTTTGTTTTPPPAAPPAASTVTYTVVVGDTLGKIAAKFHTTVTAIALANKIKNVNLIVVGQKLTITTG